MEINRHIHHRQSLRMANFDYTQNGAYFITTCTHNHQCVLGEVIQGTMRLSPWGKIVDECWRAIPIHFPNVLQETMACVIMPNHIHGIIVIDVGATHASPLHQLKESPHGPISHSLGAIVGSFKSSATRQINILRRKPGAIVWQRNYYDHIIRNAKEWSRIVEYIETNPLHWADDEENPKNSIS